MSTSVVAPCLSGMAGNGSILTGATLPAGKAKQQYNNIGYILMMEVLYFC